MILFDILMDYLDGTLLFSVVFIFTCQREIIICTMCGGVCMRVSCSFLHKRLQLHIFGNLLVLMNFYALQYFVFVNFGLLLT